MRTLIEILVGLVILATALQARRDSVNRRPRRTADPRFRCPSPHIATARSQMLGAAALGHDDTK